MLRRDSIHLILRCMYNVFFFFFAFYKFLIFITFSNNASRNRVTAFITFAITNDTVFKFVRLKYLRYFWRYKQISLTKVTRYIENMIISKFFLGRNFGEFKAISLNRKYVSPSNQKITNL